MSAASPIPNLLTGARLALGLVMFVCLAGAAGGIPFLSDRLTPEAQFQLQRWAFAAFVVAAATDGLDGWAARRLGAVTVWGAVLDPIADKILVAGAILGLSALGPNPHIAAPGALILFREFFVSALREAGAGRGVDFPVTPLAKWKTAVQLTALAAQLLIASWPAWGLQSDPRVLGPATVTADALMWIAAAITLWTGWGYWHAARRRLGTASA